MQRKDAGGVASHVRRILITGGAGFIGSHLCDRFMAQGQHVMCLDDLSTGSVRNIAHHGESDCFELLQRDVMLPIERTVDAIFNLACPASPDHYQKDPVRTMKTCVLGGLSVLELARRLGVPVLQASTSEVYGDPDVHPQPESYPGRVNPTGIRACYDEGKRALEALSFDFHRQYGVKTKVVRIFNTYGPRMASADGRAVPAFIMQALRNQPIVIYGDGQQTRSFCFVDDLVDALIALVERTDDSFTGPLNLGNPIELTVRELAETIIELVGSRSTIVHQPARQDDPRVRRPDITLARRVLNWNPKVPLREGLARTLADFEQRLARGEDQEGCAPFPSGTAERPRPFRTVALPDRPGESGSRNSRRPA